MIMLLRSIIKVCPFFQTAFLERERWLVLTVNKVKHTCGLFKAEFNCTDLCGSCRYLEKVGKLTDCKFHNVSVSEMAVE